MSKVKATPHAVSNINYHLVWIPKYRRSILQGGMKRKIKGRLSEIAEQYEFEIEEMSIQSDHLHLFVSTPPRYSPASLADILKRSGPVSNYLRFGYGTRLLYGSVGL